VYLLHRQGFKTFGDCNKWEQRRVEQRIDVEWGKKILGIKRRKRRGGGDPQGKKKREWPYDSEPSVGGR